MSMNNLSPVGMTKIINGKRYTVNTSTLLADNEYWDGNNFTRSGRNTFLYKTRGGAFFRVDMTCWQGERDIIEALTLSEAMELYEELPEHYVDYETAFDVVAEEATAGRPALYDNQPMKRVLIYLTEDMITWLKSQPGNMSEQLRALILKEINSK